MEEEEIEKIRHMIADYRSLGLLVMIIDIKTVEMLIDKIENS